ncbi:MAG: leucine-rich repeat protein [Selenomonadaceae bacterium]|nr:leucine-rich repeat protein [Selenomonadaceae bacterium]
MSNAEKILEPFQKIFAAMGISDSQIKLAAENFSLPTLTAAERKDFSEGKEFDQKILEELGKKFAPLVPFAYKEHAVILYIRDQYLSRQRYAAENYNRFHLCFCQHLRDSQKKNRYESRYVMTYETRGNFLVNLFVDGEPREQNVYRRLKVCQHCLRELNWKNFRRYCGAGKELWKGGDRAMRQRIVDDFDIAEFLLSAKANESDFPPVEFTDVSAVKKIYVLSAQKKFSLKKNVDFTCEVCRKKFLPAELEIHHKNHNQGDNRRGNLMVVCKNCHAQIHAVEGGMFVKRTENRAYADALKTLGDIRAANHDEAAAKNFYHRARNVYEKLRNDFIAQFELANLCLSKLRQLGRANQLFETCLRRATDDVNEKICVGLIYAKGLGVQKNLSTAEKIFRSISSRGDEKIFADSKFIELARLVGYVDAEKLRAQAIELFEATTANDTFAVGELVKLYGEKFFASESADDPIKNFFDDAEKILGEKISAQEKFNAVKRGDLDLILKLKALAACGDEKAQNILEELYRDSEQKNPRGGVLVLREGLTRIEDRKFYNCKQITHVVFPESLTEIGDEAFKFCGLKSLVLPAALRKIGRYAFQDSSAPVTSVTYHRQIEWRLAEYFGDRWDEITKTRLD